MLEGCEEGKYDLRALNLHLSYSKVNRFFFSNVELAVYTVASKYKIKQQKTSPKVESCLLGRGNSGCNRDHCFLL